MTQPRPAASKLLPSTQPLNDTAKLTRPAPAASVTPFLAIYSVQPLSLWVNHKKFLLFAPPEPALQARQGTLVWRRPKITAAEAPAAQQLNNHLLALVTALSALLLLLFRLWHAAH